eukprot:Em0017g585a
MAFQCMDCCRRLLQVVLAIMNIFISILGLAVLILGIVAKVQAQYFFNLSDNGNSFSNIPLLLIGVGVFVTVVGVVGSIGAIFAGFTPGRVLLMVYAIVLMLLILCEIAGGIVAAVKSKAVETSFRSGILESFKQVNKTGINDTWNIFQHTFECCGVTNYTDWLLIADTNVPPSCCKLRGKNVVSDAQCYNGTLYPKVYSQYLYSQGCANVAVGWVKNNLSAIAGVAIAFAFLQVIGVVASCFVSLYKPHSKYQVV